MEVKELLAKNGLVQQAVAYSMGRVAGEGV